MKYFLDEAPGPKKQDCKDRFRSRCLFSFRAASQISEILYLVDILYKLRMISALEWLTSLANISESDICMSAHIVISSISFQKV